MLVVNLISIINISILFILLNTGKHNLIHNKTLGLAFLIPGYYFVDNVLVLTGLIHSYPYSFFFAQVIAIFFPILLYIYVQQLLCNPIKLNPLLTSGSIILLGYILYLTYDFSQLSIQDKTEYLNGLNAEPYPDSMMLYTVSFYIWQIAYFSIMTYQSLSAIKKAPNPNAPIKMSRLNYLKNLIVFLWVFNITLVVMYLTLSIYLVDYFWLPVVVNVFYIYIIFSSYQHNTLFTNKPSYN